MTTTTASAPSEKQITFLRTLLAERAGIADAEQIRDGLNAARECGALTRQVVSGAIDCLLKIKVQRRATEVVETPEVPEGHYAVASATGNNDLDFYRVDVVTEGRWAGRTFVKRVIGGRPDSPVRGAEGIAALKRIVEAGPEAAAVLYGQEVGRCYACNRHLTDETSRSLGIGPDCRSKG